jgi:DNA-binding HxlR family transcriptional regulator
MDEQLTNLPGKQSKATATGRPIMVLLDILGQRWTMRILWELRENKLTFRELRSRCADVSPTVLNSRLKELRQQSLIEHNENGYALSIHGAALANHLLPLLEWSEQWAQAIKQKG